MEDFRIARVHAREVLDSRGNPTIEASVVLRGGAVGTAQVPSGASTGSHEALELRDGDKKRYDGLGVKKAVRHVTGPLFHVIEGMEVQHLAKIDAAMIAADGTPNKKKYGANAILALSLACAHAGAHAAQQPLYRWLRTVYTIKEKSYRMPLPMMNIMNGGLHAGWALDLQECLIIPQQKLFKERVRAGAEIFHALGRMLVEKKLPRLVGDEGGYAPRLLRNEQALVLIVEAIKQAGYVPGKDITLGIDAAASEWYDPKRDVYRMRVDGQSRTSADLLRLYQSWMKKFPLESLEDPFAEDAWDTWQRATKKMGKNMLLIGDDLFVTNSERLQRGIDEHVANAILIKVNQIGTLTETIATMRLAKKHGYECAVSHRSGETLDTTIADLAVAMNAKYLKAGSLSRSERIAKYSRVMEIEEELAH